MGVSLLVNPTAGKGRGGRWSERVATRLRGAGVDVEVLAGGDASEASALARAAVERGTEALVALGGDGMVNLALQVIAGTATPLGIVAAGTGNDLAASLGLPRGNPEAAADVVARALPAGGQAIDAVRVGSRWYGSVLGAGFDSRVNDRANRMRWPHGRMRYNLAMLAELGVFRPLAFRIELDGEVLETDAMLVAVGNGRSYGAGMQITPGAVLDDGLLDVTILGPISKLELLRTFPKVYRGTHVHHPAVRTRRARVVRLTAPGVTAYADGEFCAELPVTCECIPASVRVLVG
ncbi:MAG: diacylglycerol kinase [Mycobacteriales bacterium]